MYHLPSFQKILIPCETIVINDYNSNDMHTSISSDNTDFGDYKEKNDGAMEIYLLERYLRREFKDKLHMSEQEVVESLQNLILYLKLNLVKPSDIITENLEIKKINKVVVRNGVIVYDTQRHPILYKKPGYILYAKNDKIKSKLKRILSRGR